MTLFRGDDWNRDFALTCRKANVTRWMHSGANDVAIHNPLCAAEKNPLTQTFSPQSRGEGDHQLAAARHRDVSLIDRLFFVTLLAVGMFGFLPGSANAGGTLFIIGGGLRSGNAAIFDRLLERGGGASNCRVAIFRTASISDGDARRMSATLQRYSVPADQITLMDIRPDNAHLTAFDPANVELVNRSNVFYFIGGSQLRITQALLKEDGTDTPVLAAIRKSVDRGGVLAGTSAGAAMQSEIMLSVSGLPDDALDEGMDALDFGVSQNPHRRGLYVGRGLSFFRGGIIDQHFGQFRGRLGRLSRALIEQNVRFGFGIDENTALIVSDDGTLEVSGAGSLTIVDAKDATLTDGPLGCRIDGLRISCIENEDRFDPATGVFKISTKKPQVDSNWDFNQGNYLIADIAGRGAVKFALFQGLAENTSRRQDGIWLRYSQSFGHGYRFKFRKTDRTRSWVGAVDESYSFAVQDISLAIEPILSSLQPPDTSLPMDLPAGPSATVCQALWYRGVLKADSDRKLRPLQAITRAELAITVSNAIHLVPPAGNPVIADLPEDSEFYDAVTRLLNAKLMELDSNGRFHPQQTITRQNAAHLLFELHRHNGCHELESTPLVNHDLSTIAIDKRKSVTATIHAGLLKADDGQFRPDDPLTRQETAEAIFRILDFQWPSQPVSPRTTTGSE